MRRYFLLFILSSCGLLISKFCFSQVLFTYGNKSVSSQEFKHAFFKNAADTNRSAQAYRDYLEMYIRYKLKVQAAFDNKLDTLSSQKEEYINFKNQVAESFLNDEASVQALVEEAAERLKKEIRIAHIFIPAGTDVQAAEKEAQLVWAELSKGRSFGELARQYSKDSTSKNKNGEIGYITALVLPYKLETAIYALKPGTYSRPVKTSIGYHIFKNIDERPSRGKVHIAQILLAYPPDADAATKDHLRLKADSIYTRLKAGDDFGQMALAVSDDIFSYQAGGELPEFGVGRFDPAFEDAAFALSSDEEIGKPFLSAYGWHILKRLNRRLPDYTGRQDLAQLRSMVESSDRMELAKSNLVRKIKTQTGFRKSVIDEKQLLEYSNAVYNQQPFSTASKLNSKTILFTFKNSPVYLSAWKNYLDNLRNSGVEFSGENFPTHYNQFLESATLDYYKQHLEEYNPEYRAQLKEFREGNLMFEVMQREIWEKSANDSSALHQYYAEHKDKYWWEPSADAVIFTAANESLAAELQKVLESNPGEWQKFIADHEGFVQADSGRFELNQIPVAGRTNFTEGLVTAPVKDTVNNNVVIAYIRKIYPQREKRSFEEAKGYVINDYQSVLEEEWIAKLKKRYPVKVNVAVFNAILPN